MINDEQIGNVHAILHNLLHAKHYKIVDLMLCKAKPKELSQAFMQCYLEITKPHIKNLPSRNNFLQSCKDEITTRNEKIIKGMKQFL